MVLSSYKQHNEKSRWFESREVKDSTNAILVKAAQAESTVHMLNWAIRSVKFLGVEFD